MPPSAGCQSDRNGALTGPYSVSSLNPELFRRDRWGITDSKREPLGRADGESASNSLRAPKPFANHQLCVPGGTFSGPSGKDIGHVDQTSCRLAIDGYGFSACY